MIKKKSYKQQNQKLKDTFDSDEFYKEKVYKQLTKQVFKSPSNFYMPIDNSSSSISVSGDSWKTAITSPKLSIEDIASRKFNEIIPMIEGLLREAYNSGFSDGVAYGVLEVEKQLNEIFDTDVIRKAQKNLQTETGQESLAGSV
jgi:hypothetical protein